MKKNNVKRLTFFLAILFLPFYLNAQIRDYVGIVEEHFHPEIVSYLEKFRDELSQNGYKTYGKLIDSYLAGGFGSGFVYVAPDGTNYVITNRHVVNQAATASVKFEDAETGNVVQYDDLTVAVLDDDIDLAILKFKDNAKPFKSGLPISQKNLSDGQDVWSAGFPALGDEPIWQLGKGTITNSRARIKELIDPSISTIIQHSAEIDSGNSGGPLLISANNSVGYEVIGVNTWKAAYRQNTNFAIPAAMVTKMLDKASKKNDSDLSDAQLYAKKIIEELNNKNGDFTVFAKYISEELTLASGKKDFISTLKFAPSDVRAVVADAFAYAPIEGMRYAVAYQLWKKLSAAVDEEKTISEKESSLNGSAYDVALSIFDGQATMKLIKEKGLWRISELTIGEEKGAASSKASASTKPSAKTSASEKNYDDEAFEKPAFFFELSSPVNFRVSVGGAFNTDGFDFSGIAVNLEYLASTWFGMHAFYYGHKMNSETKGILGAGIEVRVPMNFNDVCNLELFAKAAPGFCFGKEAGGTYTGYVLEGGLNLAVTNDWKCMPGFGISYAYGNLTEFGVGDGEMGINEIRFYVSLSF